jgi:hypothetical protein
VEQKGFSPTAYARYFVVLDILLVLGFCIPALIIFWRRSDDWLGMFVSLVLVTVAVGYSGELAGYNLRPEIDLQNIICGYAYVLFILVLLYVFPDGRFIPPWTRLTVPVGILWASTHLLPVPYRPFSWPYFLGNLADLAMLVLPLAFTFSILGYRLYDIDIILNRTLVYVPLTAILAGLYSASITLSQKLFIAATGQESDAAIVLTTLVLASTFTPIKNALQSIVDARFKEAPDPSKKMKALVEEVRSRIFLVDPKEITRRLLEEAIQALRRKAARCTGVNPASWSCCTRPVNGTAMNASAFRFLQERAGRC